MSLTLTDMFCGCGGSSQGATKVSGVDVRLAMNHWQMAVNSHQLNHPNTDHDCADIQATDPRRYGRTDILIASPECTNHTIANGKKKPQRQADLFISKMIDDSVLRSRATMWDVVRFTEIHRYEAVIVENVVDVRTWVSYEDWIRTMINLGYKHKVVFLNAMFCHGPEVEGFAPQSRDRIYIVFWKKGNKAPDLDIRPVAPCKRCCKDVGAVQSFKPGASPKARYKAQYVYVCPTCGDQTVPYYYCALNCLDLSLPMVKISERHLHGLKELSDNTIARINYGLRKFGLHPTIIDERNRSGSERARVWDALGDVVNAQHTGFSSYMASPFLFDMAHSKTGHNGHIRGLHDALHTQTTQQSNAMVMDDVLIRLLHQANRSSSPMHDVTDGVIHTQTSGLQEYLVGLPILSSQYGNTSAYGVHDAVPTTSGSDKTALVIAPSALLTMRGGRSLDPVTDATPTQVAAGIQNWLLSTQPFLSPYHGGSQQASSTTEASSTIAGADANGYVEARQAITAEDCYFRMLQPHETLRAQGFPEGYQILGNKEQMQKQIGNANPPPTMNLLVSRVRDSLAVV
jgi:DNA (cytosine-5)-methyltransferase 1